MNIFLKIAKDNLLKARRVKNADQRAISKRNEYAVTVVICSACAVECHTNVLISLALFRKKTAKGRKQLGLLIKRHLKVSIRDKLNDVSSICSIPKNLKKHLRDLFQERNRVIHAAPEYSEARYIPDEMFKEGEVADVQSFMESLPTRPSLALLSFPLDYTDIAEKAFKTASDYIAQTSPEEYFRHLA